MDIDRPLQPSSTSHILSDSIQPPFPIDPEHLDPAPRRRPGRPKGSGKKSLDPPPSLPKIKRPVGRPRKDGFPAGSVRTGRRTVRPKRSASDRHVDTLSQPVAEQGHFPFTADTQPQWPGGLQSTFDYTTVSTSPMATNAHPQPVYPVVDPNLDREDDWAELARNEPAKFLSTLLTSLSAPNPVSTAGPTVEEAFRTHLVSLSPKIDPAKGSQPIPPLYSILKTFWLPCSPTYFSLTASSARTPSEHRFLYWDPQPLVFNGIACPSCSVPLINKGRIRSGPVKVYDLDTPFFIIGCEYVCKSTACVAHTSADGRKFASTDSSILRSLPARLRDEFPAHLMQDDPGAGSGLDVWNWQAMGVSRSLWNMVKGCLKVGLGKSAILQVIRAIEAGVSDEHEKKEEEEDEEEAPAVGGEVHPRSLSIVVSDRKDKTADDSHQGWKANNPIGQAVSQPGPSSIALAPSQGSGTLTPQPQASFQHAPCVPYGYYTFFQQQPSGQPSGSNTHSTPTRNTPDPGHVQMKRPYTFATDGVSNPDVVILEPSQKRTRHCCKCGSQECKGKGGRSFCMNACQDCGKLECKGRNSRRPDKKCDEAWS